MTAEVAVMNRLAVALAADSAVTVGSGEATKIFQNENKLFELSLTKPVGLMIYNATQFFGVPWEIIIKDFRRDKGGSTCAKLFDWVDEFESYVMERFPPSEAAQKAFVRQRFADEFGAVLDNFIDTIRPFLTQRYKKSHDEAYRRRLNDALDDALQSYDEWAFAETISHEEAENYLSVYSDEYLRAYDEHFGRLPLEDDDKAKVRSLAVQVLKGAKPGDYTTGLVFAGFGDHELFPSLQCVEINGVVADRLRRVQMELVDIDRAGSTAEVIPFAQRDTADSLIKGRSATYQSQAVRQFSEVAQQLGDALVEGLVKSGAKRKDYKERLQGTCQEGRRGGHGSLCGKGCP